MRANQNSTESLPKPRVLELSHGDEGNYPGKRSKVWVPGRRLRTAEAEQEAASTGCESLQSCSAMGGQSEGPRLQTKPGCGQEGPFLSTSRTLGSVENVGVGDKGGCQVCRETLRPR